MKYLVRVIPSLAALVVGGASFVLSFVALSEVAAEVEAVPAQLAWLVPLVVDGGVLAGSASLWAASYRQTRRDPVAYVTVAGLLAFSVVVNVNHAGEGLLAKAIAALPPIVLLACLELVAAGHRREFIASESGPAASPVATPVPTAAAQSAAHAEECPVVAPLGSAAASATPAPVDVSPAATPQETADTTLGNGPAKAGDGSTKADRIRALYDTYVLAGMDPRGPEVVQVIAQEVSVAESYVRRVIRPSRAGRVRAESPAGRS